MRILITGAGGFAGRHLAAHLRAVQPESSLFGTTIGASSDMFPAGVEPGRVDLRDEAAVAALVDWLQPDQVYHLAGTANVRSSPNTPQEQVEQEKLKSLETIENNTYTTLYLLRACHALPAPPRVLVVTTGEFYERGQGMCAHEATPINPTKPYGISKLAQEMLALQYSAAGLPVIRARAFNHIGRGQRQGFVVSDFASQIARIEAALQPPSIRCGNLRAERDFTDVRDMVRAYVLLMQQGVAGEVYNIASGRSVPMRTVLDMLIDHSSYRGRIEVEPTTDLKEDRLCGDASKLRALTGWAPAFTLEQTLAEALDDWRERVRAEVPGAR